MSKTVFLMWDCYGIESAFSVSNIEQQRMWATLKGEDPNRIPMPLSLIAMKIRAEANLHRNYEIYLLQTDDDVRVDDIVTSFESAPQQMADTVRRLRHRVYGRTIRRDDEQRVRIR